MNRTKESLQVELDTSFLYGQLSQVQKDQGLSEVLRQMSGIEQEHALHALEKIRETEPGFPMPGPSRRARIQWKLGKIFGYDYILGQLMSTEYKMAQTAVQSKVMKGGIPSGMESTHLRIVEAVSANQPSMVTGGFLTKLEGRHRSVGGNALRAAVMGANDGLVSNMSLVMGVAGAAASSKTILMTGLAGLLAGALSMSLGEWLSVQSSRELYQRQIDLEEEEMENSPEQEKKELTLLYLAKGMSHSQATDMVSKIFENKETALNTMVREELGIDKEELGGSAWVAAFTSFILFAIGAIIPVFPFFFTEGNHAVLLSLGFCILGLFTIGGSITLFTGRSVLFSGFRMVLFGLAAAAITFGIGRLIGVSIGG
jgi:VIT1/CCC1 family predicted Fe2+/Mn2+ transporter